MRFYIAEIVAQSFKGHCRRFIPVTIAPLCWLTVAHFLDSRDKGQCGGLFCYLKFNLVRGGIT